MHSVSVWRLAFRSDNYAIVGGVGLGSRVRAVGYDGHGRTLHAGLRESARVGRETGGPSVPTRDNVLMKRVELAGMLPGR